MNFSKYFHGFFHGIFIGWTQENTLSFGHENLANKAWISPEQIHKILMGFCLVVQLNVNISKCDHLGITNNLIKVVPFSYNYLMNDIVIAK